MNSPETENNILEGINWVGLKTLYLREVQRFLKIIGQTILAPAITVLLFLAVFGIVFGSERNVAGLEYQFFLVPGLIMMATLQSAFANTSTSIIQQKIHDSILDLLVTPLNSIEIAISFIFGGVTRGVLVALSTTISLSLFVSIEFYNLWFIFIHLFASTILMSSIGMVTGIWAEKFDHVSTISNFVILPLSFLSGTFFPIDRFPVIIEKLSYFNPFFYILDGFRYGFTGVSQGSLSIGITVVLITNICVISYGIFLIHIGYKLRA